MTQLYSTSIEPLWSKARDIRSAVGELLMHYPTQLRSAAMMAASELVENAIKFGEKVPSAPSIFFTLSAQDDELRIETRNGCTKPALVDELAARLDRLAQVADKSSLYIARLEELLADPDDTGRLGLYRIAFEGEFELEYCYRDEVVTVTALRRIE